MAKSNGKVNAVSRVDGTFREIQLLEQAAAFLAECQDLDEVKELRDKAEALRLYQKKIGDSQRSQNTAAEIKIRAERRMGELIPQLGIKWGGDRAKSHDATLASIDLSKSESSRVQSIAAVPPEKFEATIAEVKGANRELTSKEMVRIGQTEQRLKRKRESLEANGQEAPAMSIDRTWQIVQGDCMFWFGSEDVHGLDWERMGWPADCETPICEGEARLIFADPPYNIGVDYGAHYDDLRPADEFDSWCQEWLMGCHRLLTEDGSLWLLVNHEWAPTLCFRAEDVGFHLRQWITWYESFGVNTTRMFNRCSRPLLWLVKDAGRFVFNAEAVMRPSDRQEKYNDNRANQGGKLWDDVWGVNPPIPRLVGTAKERMPDFPTQLPLALLRPIIGCASDPGDLVIDPFSGSGTTGAACIELGRRFVGIELSEDFAAASRLRLRAMGDSHVASQDQLR